MKKTRSFTLSTDLSTALDTLKRSGTNLSLLVEAALRADTRVAAAMDVDLCWRCGTHLPLDIRCPDCGRPGSPAGPVTVCHDCHRVIDTPRPTPHGRHPCGGPAAICPACHAPNALCPRCGRTATPTVDRGISRVACRACGDFVA